MRVASGARARRAPLRDRSTLLRRSVLPLAAASVTLIATVLLVAGLLPETVLPGGAAATGIDAWEGSAGPAVGASHDLVGFDDALLADIERYRAPRRSIALLAFVVSVTVPLLMAVALRDGRAVRTLTLARLLPSTALQAAAAAGIVVLVTALARLPLSVWSGVVHDGRWGFRTRSAPGWLLDHLAVVGGRALGVGALVWMFAALILRHPRDWSARVVLLTAVVGPVALLLHPLVIHPVLLPTGPMPDGAHSDAVAAVIARSDIEVPVLLGEASLRTTRRNAVATGLGPTARIVLHDTLLELEPREVAAITAHEVAHLERRDPLRAALAPVPFVMLLTWLLQRRLRSRGRPDVRTLAAVASLVLALEAAATPVTAGLSRTIEHRADVRSVQLSQDPSAHVTMLRAFVTDGLADPDPPRWTVLLRATHPTPRERIVAVSGGSGPATR